MPENDKSIKSQFQIIYRSEYISKRFFVYFGIHLFPKTMIFLLYNSAKPHYFTFLYYRFLFIHNSKIKHNIQKNVDFYADLCYNYSVLLCADLAQSRLILLVDLECETEPSLLREYTSVLSDFEIFLYRLSVPMGRSWVKFLRDRLFPISKR